MDSRNLNTASSYINNLLLSRGLLRNGAPIAFAEPAKAEGGVDATMAQVMNLVHDLILRRDVSSSLLLNLRNIADNAFHQREADTLSTLSQSLQTLRTSSAQQTQACTRLEARNAELDRQCALSAAQEKTARSTLRTAETRTRALREEMARLKGTVAQIRAQCANDIRKRDTEISRLKRHLEGRRGREGNGGQVGVVVITPGPTRSQFQGSRDADAGADLGSPEYSLKQETTEFLTQLSQGLSDENDALIGLVRNTLETLRSLQGLPADHISTESGYSLNGSSESANPMITAPPSYEELATNMDEVLEHLRGLLTNPSFVPLEEVEIREEEIVRLRNGLERMVARWKEAVAMMDGWRKRMVDSGDTINLDDLTKGMNLAPEMPTAPEPQQDHAVTLAEDEEELSASVESAEGLGNPLESPKAPPVDDEEIEALAAGIPTESRILQPRSGNARPALSPRKVSFQSPPGEAGKRGYDEALDESLLDFSGHLGMFSPIKKRPRTAEPVSNFPLTVAWH